MSSDSKSFGDAKQDEPFEKELQLKDSKCNFEPTKGIEYIYSKTRTILQYSWGILLAILFFGSFLSVVVNHFWGAIPYLHESALMKRVLIVFLIWSGAFIFYLAIASSQQKKSVIETLNYDLKHWLGACLGIVIFIFATAWPSAGTLGLLVVTLPNTPYQNQMEIIGAQTRGSKNKANDLDLKTPSNGKVYYLTLSKRRFDCPQFEIGESLQLKGKQNWFGVYIEQITSTYHGVTCVER